jgi:hypothetical protein
MISLAIDPDHPAPLFIALALLALLFGLIIAAKPNLMFAESIDDWPARASIWAKQALGYLVAAIGLVVAALHLFGVVGANGANGWYIGASIIVVLGIFVALSADPSERLNVAFNNSPAGYALRRIYGLIVAAIAACLLYNWLPPYIDVAIAAMRKMLGP